MSYFQLEDMLRAGVHFGHLARRWSPKMKPYIFMEKNGVHIIDLQKTLVLADDALNALDAIAQTGREIMFVGTKKQDKKTLFHPRPNGLECLMCASAGSEAC